jgi:hypothetical protein
MKSGRYRKRRERGGGGIRESRRRIMGRRNIEVKEGRKGGVGENEIRE